MLSLDTDIIICHIIPLLADIDRIHWCSINRHFRTQILSLIRFDDMYEVLPGNSDKWYFNQLTNIKTFCTEFPSGIIKIIFQEAFHEQLLNPLPNTIRELTFPKGYSFDLVGILPNSLTHLTFGWDLKNDLTQIIPPSIQYLNILLPVSLTTLYKSRRFRLQAHQRTNRIIQKIREALDLIRPTVLEELRIEGIVIQRSGLEPRSFSVQQI
jgi:hypothetical protein